MNPSQNIHVERAGLQMPKLGLGTWQMTGETCVEAVRHALEIGYRHIDTARAYENERDVGTALADAAVDREDIFLTTKIWFEDLAPDDLTAAAEDSLSNLQTDYVDLLLIHWPNPEIELEAALDAMQALVDDGKARHIGVSNFPPSWVERACEHADIACNQVEYQPYLPQQRLLCLARELDHAVTAYSPLARGRVTKDPVLQDMADALGRTPAQLTLRWLIQQDGVAAIPKAASAEHRRANLAALEFELTDEQMARIFDLAEGERVIDPSFAPDWERGGA